MYRHVSSYACLFKYLQTFIDRRLLGILIEISEMVEYKLTINKKIIKREKSGEKQKEYCSSVWY